MTLQSLQYMSVHDSFRRLSVGHSRAFKGNRRVSCELSDLGNDFADI